MLRWIPVACIALSMCGCAHHSATTADGRATVVHVVDGDTIVVHIGGRDENVRLLDIDTPETQKTPLVPGSP
jgi:endonuclease YncB( thermonuclease family)